MIELATMISAAQAIYGGFKRVLELNEVIKNNEFRGYIYDLQSQSLDLQDKLISIRDENLRLNEENKNLLITRDIRSKLIDTGTWYQLPEDAGAYKAGLYCKFCFDKKQMLLSVLRYVVWGNIERQECKNCGFKIGVSVLKSPSAGFIQK